MNTLKEKQQALALFLELEIKEREINDKIEQSIYDNDAFNTECGEFLILTDDEAGDRWGEYLQQSIDEVLPELPRYLKKHFDHSKWIQDAKNKGRGACFAHYDNIEYQKEYNGIVYYIYRTN